jgi:hypothetical protein
MPWGKQRFTPPAPYPPLQARRPTRSVLGSSEYHTPGRGSYRLGASRSMTRAATVLTRETSITATRNAMWANVPQIASGMPSNTARAMAKAPVTAVRDHRPVSSAQHGPAMSNPIRMRRCPRRASATAIRRHRAMLSIQSRSADHPQGVASWLVSGTVSQGARFTIGSLGCPLSLSSGELY